MCDKEKVRKDAEKSLEHAGYMNFQWLGANFPLP